MRHIRQFGSLVRVFCSVPMLAALVSACAPAAPKPAGELVTQAAQIQGEWETYGPGGSPAYVFFRPDGTTTWSPNRDGSRASSGKYRFEGGQFRITDDFCAVEGQYEAYLKDVGDGQKALTFKVIKDDCADVVEALTTRDVTWVSALP